jgi:CubicO group peptidase (beta-lactamase class C family)
MLSRVVLGAIAVVGLLLASRGASAQRGVQWAPDGASRLVSTDVGGERWAIRVDVEDGTVIGNVFRPDGGPPQFVWCWPQSTADDPVRLRCEGTTGCDDWVDLGEVELPGSFLSPPTSCDASAAVAAAPGRPSDGALESPSALRLSPDERRTLISKDVGGLRWAMVYDPERSFPGASPPARLTGNVFDPGGGAPQFVACEEAGRAGGDQMVFRCAGASACGCAPCAPSDWTPIGEVVLPQSFVEERRCPARAAPAGGLVARFASTVPEDAATFGATVAVAGATAAVSVPRALYVYERTAAGWEQVARVAAPDSERFGRGIAMTEGRIAVGDDHRALIYERVDGAWRLTATLSPQGVETGRLVAMSGDLLVLSSGDEDERSAVITYERSGDGWRETERLSVPADLFSAFFRAVALSGDTLATVVLAQAYDGADFLPFVQTYERRGAAWIEAARIASSTPSYDFGRAIALSGDTLAVGRPPSFSRESREDDGIVLLFEKVGDEWIGSGTLHTCSPEAGRFGTEVVISGDGIAVGASAFSGSAAAGDVHRFQRTADGWQETGRFAYADAAPAAPGPAQRRIALDGTTLVAGASGAVAVFDLSSPDVAPPAPCPPPAPELWPTEEWQVGDPAAHGMNPVLLERAREYAFQPGKNTQGVVVVRHGAVVAEWYEDGRGADSYAASWSDAKSVAGTVIGIAIDRGVIPGVEASMATFYPEWSGTEKEAMTLRHVLSMTSGLDWEESYVTDPSNLSDIARLAATESDQLGFVLAKPLAFEPGTYHSYSSADTLMLSGVIESALGTSFGAYAREVLFDPIGMTRAQWWTDAVGHTLTYCCLDAPSREFARFGLLWARGGRWADRQVISEEYVRAALTPTVTDGPEGLGIHSYGFQWWLGAAASGRYAGDGFSARGYDGQYIYVFPSLDLVVVRNGHYEKDPGPPIADPNLFTRYPAAGLGNGRGTVPPDRWSDATFLRPILDSILDRGEAPTFPSRPDASTRSTIAATTRSRPRPFR